jgi:hypothetical protein
MNKIEQMSTPQRKFSEILGNSWNELNEKGTKENI